MAEPIDPAEANEPTLANDAKLAALPIESTESWEQIESTEFSDQRDHTIGSVANLDAPLSTSTGRLAGVRVTWRPLILRPPSRTCSARRTFGSARFDR